MQPCSVRVVTEVSSQCLAGNTRVICATIAFGLGMDLPGVGLMVHRDVATSLRDVQQIGRGGRCGCNCLCITFYNRAFMQQALRQAAGTKDRTRRQAELGSILEHCQDLPVMTSHLLISR
jgi:superfamily II DNA helicase RecQ